jgi:hypothetical protein
VIDGMKKWNVIKGILATDQQCKVVEEVKKGRRREKGAC